MIPPRLIIGLIGLALIVAAAAIIPGCVRDWQSQRAQSRMNAGQAGAAQETGRDAIGTVSNRAASDAGSEELSRNNARDIANAPGASDRVNPGVDAAGRAAICKRPSMAARPECARYKETPR